MGKHRLDNRNLGRRPDEPAPDRDFSCGFPAWHGQRRRAIAQRVAAVGDEGAAPRRTLDRTDPVRTRPRHRFARRDRVRSLRQACQNLRHGRGGLLRISALPSLGLGAIPAAVARFLADHEDIMFDLQTLHHDEMVRKLYEHETDIAISFEVPLSAPVAHQVIGEGELVVIYREEDMPAAPPRLHLDELRGQKFISPVQSGPIGRMLSSELSRLEVELDEVVSARTYYVAAALVSAGVGMAIVDNFTAHAALPPGLASRPLQPAITFDINAVYLQNRPLSRTAADFLMVLATVIEGL